MSRLKVEEAENGFVVYEDCMDRAMAGRVWAFESATSLAEFMKLWATRRVEVKSDADSPNAARGI